MKPIAALLFFLALTTIRAQNDINTTSEGFSNETTDPYQKILLETSQGQFIAQTTFDPLNIQVLKNGDVIFDLDHAVINSQVINDAKFSIMSPNDLRLIDTTNDGIPELYFRLLCECGGVAPVNAIIDLADGFTLSISLWAFIEETSFLNFVNSASVPSSKENIQTYLLDRLYEQPWVTDNKSLATMEKTIEIGSIENRYNLENICTFLGRKNLYVFMFGEEDTSVTSYCYPNKTAEALGEKITSMIELLQQNPVAINPFQSASEITYLMENLSILSTNLTQSITENQIMLSNEEREDFILNNVVPIMKIAEDLERAFELNQSIIESLPMSGVVEQQTLLQRDCRENAEYWCYYAQQLGFIKD